MNKSSELQKETERLDTKLVRRGTVAGTKWGVPRPGFVRPGQRRGKPEIFGRGVFARGNKRGK